VDAFKATLEETTSATLLLHIIDVSSANRENEMADVDAILDEIGAKSLPKLLVFNKVDMLGQSPRVVRNQFDTIEAVYLSARTGEGMQLLLEAIRERLTSELFEEEISLDPTEGSLRAALYDFGAVCHESWEEDGSSRMRVRLPLADWQRLTN